MSNPTDHDTDRRSFLRSACVGGAIAGLGIGATPGSQEPPGLPREWIAAVLPMMAELDPAEARRMFEPGSDAHFRDLGMEATLSRFRGDLPAFLDFLRGEWAWIIDYDAEAGVVLVNENKSRCVCPLVAEDHGDDLGVLCYCSEGFAERMFTKVTGAPARARVTQSILRGGERCRYRIELSPSGGRPTAGAPV
jgi:hypothetical protein